MEAYAALQIAASILQVIDIGTRVVKRLHEYHQNSNGLPNSFKHINKRLPLFLDALRQTSAALESMSDATRKAFVPAVEECLAQIRNLEVRVDAVLPKPDDSGRTRSWKAIISVKSDSEIKQVDRVIREYMELMAQHQTSTLVLRHVKSSKPLLTPVSTCPFPRDDDFIERDIMNEVLSRCQPGSKLALTGIGGIGKSQVAIEYTYRVRHTSPDTWVFWVDAKSVVSIEGSYRNFAKAVRLPGWDEKDTHILASVRDWLDTDGNGPWVMIMDSADDTSVLTAPVGPSAQHDQGIDTSLLPQVREYLPISRNGAMLVTSTNSTAAQLITGNFSHHIEMEEMCENESLALLKSKLHPKVIYTEEQAKNLVKAAEYMPLAVSQTAACISLEYPRLTLVQATEKLNNPGADAISLLEESIHEPNRDVRRTNSVVKSWHLSFQYVRQTSPSAARLLSLMCLFDRQGIPEALLSGHYNEKPATVLTPPEPHPTWWTRIRRPRRKNRGVYSNKSVTKTKTSDFHADWCILNGLMLVKTNVDGCHFNMHRLVQCTTQRWLELNGELETWTNKYVLLMNIVFPEIEYDHFDICQYLFPHAQQVANYRPTNPFILKLWAPLIQKISRYAYLRGGFACAENLGRMALATFEALVGERHECTLRSLHQLAEVLNRTKSYPEAETLFRRAWEGKQATLGPDDPDTLESMKRLGEVLGSQNKTQEAWQTALHVIEGYERFYGPTHSQTQGKLVLTAFGFILNEQFEQAANIQRRLYGIHREIYGDDSDKTYETMGALAGLLTLTGNASEAEALLRPVVAAFEGRYGLHRLLTIQSINRLGEALTSQGKLEETAALYQCVLDVYSDLDEKAREAALNSADNYAQVLCKQSHLGGAEEMGRWMVGQRELLLGTDHLDTLVGVHTLAGIMAAQEKPQEAVTLFERAYHGTEKIAGPDHSDTVEFLEDFNHAKRKVESDMPPS